GGGGAVHDTKRARAQLDDGMSVARTTYIDRTSLRKRTWGSRESFTSGPGAALPLRQRCSVEQKETKRLVARTAPSDPSLVAPTQPTTNQPAPFGGSRHDHRCHEEAAREVQPQRRRWPGPGDARDGAHQKGHHRVGAPRPVGLWGVRRA